jgi:hypothetical protein
VTNFIGDHRGRDRFRNRYRLFRVIEEISIPIPMATPTAMYIGSPHSEVNPESEDRTVKSLTNFSGEGLVQHRDIVFKLEVQPAIPHRHPEMA